ncbi:MAG TPA: flagellar biosynthesis anti-sigma factor FlgM [Spirochaetia bacterium]|nr:flagellar biosynthesis anti-sigma factor FlgM [Spirochaetia bacterium]
MSIERLGPIDPVSKYNKPEKNQRLAEGQGKDSIAFSDEARIKADLYRATEQVRQAPDVRLDRIAEVKKKLEDPNYINNKVLSGVADRVMEMFDI